MYQHLQTLVLRYEFLQGNNVPHVEKKLSYAKEISIHLAKTKIKYPAVTICCIQQVSLITRTESVMFLLPVQVQTGKLSPYYLPYLGQTHSAIQAYVLNQCKPLKKYSRELGNKTETLWNVNHMQFDMKEKLQHHRDKTLNEYYYINMLEI